MLVHPGLPQRYVASIHLCTLPCSKACQAQERGGGEEERNRRRDPFPSLPDPLSLFPSKPATQTDIPVVHALDSTIHRTNLYPVDQQYRNQLRHPLNRGFVNSVTHLSNNWAPGKERCSKAKSPVKGNNLTPRLEYGPLNVMFEVLPRYQSLRLYFCISNVMHNRYKYAQKLDKLFIFRCD